MGRPPVKKSGPMTATKHQRRWRRATRNPCDATDMLYIPYRPFA